MTGLTTALAALSILVVGSTVTAKDIALELNDIADDLSTKNINFMFDLILKHYISKISEEGRAQQPIEDFVKRFTTKIYTTVVEAVFEAKDGLIGNFSTLNRTGDADLSNIGPDLILNAHLGLNDLKVEYNEYDISFLGKQQRGKIHVTVGANSISLKMKLETKPMCVVLLQDWTVEKLDNVNVDITNLGIFESVINDVTSWIKDEVIKHYRHYIENTLLPELSEVMQKADLCNYKPK